MKTLFVSLMALLALAWGWDIVHAPAPENVHVLWLARQQGLYLSGLLSVAMMSLAKKMASGGSGTRARRSAAWAPAS